jgi:hypothetical protein
MDSMKTKFYKRLVPIALIASMAVTNVGMTSASAAEISNSVEITQTGSVQNVDLNAISAGIEETAARRAPIVATSFTGVNAKDDPVFQIPGGMTSKTSKVNGYTIGIAKVIADAGTTSLTTNNEVRQADVAAHSAKTNNGGDKLTASNAAVGSYVMYYATSKEPKVAGDTTNNVTFFRLLHADEVANLPITYKTEATLTKNPSNALDTTKEAGVMNAFVKAYINMYFFGNTGITDVGGTFGTTVPKANQGNTIKNLIDSSGTPKGDLNGITASNCLWKDKPAAKDETPAKDQDGQIALPAVSKASSAITELDKDDEIVKALIKGTAGWTTGSSTDSDNDVDSDGKIVTTTGHGWNKLLDTAKLDPKKYFGKMEIYTQLEARAKAIFLNYLNDVKFTDKEYDLTKIVWVLEKTDSSNKETDTVSGKDVYPATSTNAKFWGKSYALKSGNDVIGKTDAAVTKTRGASVVVTNTSPAGKFNASVYIKGVSSDYVPGKKGQEDHTGKVCFTQGFYIPPAVPSAFKDKSLIPPAAKTGIKLEKYTGWENKDTKRNYKLTLDAGKSFKLPFALADGQEKDLVYKVASNSSGFTVIDGKVTAVSANTNAQDTFTVGTANTIQVYSRAVGSSSLYATVSVKVNPSAKAVRSNATSIAVWPGSEQIISLGTVPASKNDAFKYKVSCSDSNVKLCASGSTTALGSTLITDGLLKVKVEDTVDTSKIAKGTTIKVELYDATTNKKISLKKDYTIKVTGVAAPQDIKSVKTAVKSKETAEYTDSGSVKHMAKVINVPVGGSVNLGYAPSAGANASVVSALNVGTVNGESVTAASNCAEVSGDVVTGIAVGAEVVKLSPAATANISDTFKVTDTEDNGDVYYMINVYEPGSSIILPDTDYAVKGGFLMTKTQSDTTCEHNFKAGDMFAMKLPTANSTEPIIWKANDPSAVKFVKYNLASATTSGYYNGKDTGDYLEITPAKAGTFTITGTTKYTKQKLTFKLVSTATNEKAGGVAYNGTSVLSFTSADGTPISFSGTQTPVYVGDKINACLVSGEADFGGPVEFSITEGSNLAKIDKKGVITCKGAGTITVSATMTAGSADVATQTQEITISPANVTLKSAKIPYGVAAEQEFAVSASLNNYNKKNVDLQWYAVESGDDITKDNISVTTANTPGARYVSRTAFDDIDKEKTGGKVHLDVAGSYDIYVNVMKKGETELGTSAANVISVVKVGTVRVYGSDDVVKKADLNMGDADAKKAIANLAAKPKDANNKEKLGAGNDHTYYIPVYATDANGEYLAAKNADDVVLEVSNKALLVDAATGISFIPRTASGFHATNVVARLKDNTQENDIVKNYENAYGLIKVDTATVASKFTGVLTVKATVKSLNKALTFKLNLLGKALAPAVPYAPQDVKLNGAFDNDRIVLSAIVKADTSATLIDGFSAGEETLKKIAKEKKLAEGKKITVWQYVLVSDYKLANVNKDLEGKAIICNTAKVSQGVNPTVESLIASGTVGTTYYLALAQVEYEVTTPYAAKTTDTDEQPAVISSDGVIKKVTAIASKTPMVAITP